MTMTIKTPAFVTRSLCTCLLAATALLATAAHAQLTVYVVRHGQTDWSREGPLPGGEALKSQARRSDAALRKIRDKHPTGGTVTIVGHGGINPLLVSQLQGVPPQEGASAIHQGNDEIYRIDISKAGVASIWKLVPRSKLGEL